MTSTRSKLLDYLGGICLFYERPQWRDAAYADLQRALVSRRVEAYLKLEAIDAHGVHIVRIGASAKLSEITPSHDTTAIAAALQLEVPDQNWNLDQEILLAMARSPVAFTFPSISEFDSAIRIRRHTARAAARATLSFDPHGLERPTDCWTYHPSTSFTLLPGVSLISALRKTIEPDQNGRAYSFSCYRASEYVQLLGLAEHLHEHNPGLLERIEARWRRCAVMSDEFHQIFMYEVGTIDQPLPSRYYVPGDRVWFRNPDEPSSDVYGYEGSWVYYIGEGKFNNFWNSASPYTLTDKCLEIYHWRDGASRDAGGALIMDEAVVQARVAQSLSDPRACDAILRRMMRMRDVSGVYRDGGCIDATRESLRWVCEVSRQMETAAGECDVVARAA
ncbi:MAG: hypothetical protein IT507_07820 [Burkholderiaceae bacterium]|nr:hypothetical protein [Burkholderiaceae bacterium]